MLDEVTAAQVAPVFMDKEATIDKACRTIEERLERFFEEAL